MITRRGAIRTGLAAIAAALAGAPGCAGVRSIRSRSVEGRVRIVEAELADGAVYVDVDGLPDPLLVIPREDGSIVALSSRCTHQGCRVKPTRGFVTCPCHGSVFDRDGTVVRGPAPMALPAFPVRRAGGVIEISLTHRKES